MFSAATGFIIASPLTVRTAPAASGVFLLACGCSALNQYQERNTDALMLRTRNRPLPAGRIRPANALYFSVLLLLAGFTALAFTKSPAVLLSGSCAVILYNGVYTYLKKITAFASVPCSVIGTIPPAIGWLAGGGGLPDSRIMALCFLFFMWQITHFWLLFLSHGHDYETAGFPSLTTVFSVRQLDRIVFIWFLSTAAASLLFPVYGLIKSVPVILVLVTAVMFLIWNGARLLVVTCDRAGYRSAFCRMNSFIMLIMLLLSLDSLAP